MDRVNYHRILQMKESDIGAAEDIKHRFADTYLQHYQEMLRHRANPSDSRTNLMIAPAHYPITFLVVETRGGEQLLDLASRGTHPRVRIYLGERGL